MPQAHELEEHHSIGPSGSSRLAKLHECFAKCLDYGMKNPTLQDFQKNFPGLTPAVVEALYETYTQMLDLVRYNCQMEFKDICKEYGLQQFLGALDQCAEAHEADALANGERGDAAAAVAETEKAAKMQALQVEADRLQDLLDKANTQQDRLKDALAMRQGHVDKVANTYDDAITDVKQVYDVTKAWPPAPGMPE